MRPQDGPLGLRRATAMFSVVAWAGALLVVVMGVMMLGRSSGGSPTSVSLRDAVGAGEPVTIPTTTSTVLLWGAPTTVDLAAVTCTAAAPSGERDLAVTTDPTVAVDTGQGRDVVLLLEVETMPRVDEVTCSGGGLEQVGRSAAANAGVERGFGVFLLLLAPVLAVLGIVARRASRPSPSLR